MSSRSDMSLPLEVWVILFPGDMPKVGFSLTEEPGSTRYVPAMTAEGSGEAVKGHTFVARIDPCNRVWIEDAEHGRHPADRGLTLRFPQSASKTKAKEYFALAQLMAAAPETARQLEAERALNAELVEALKSVRETLQNGTGENPDGTWWSHARRINAALAKAEARLTATRDTQPGLSSRKDGK